MAGVDQKWNDNIFGQKCQCVRKKGASYLWLGVPRKVRGEICTIFAHTPCNGLQSQWFAWTYHHFLKSLFPDLFSMSVCIRSLHYIYQNSKLLLPVVCFDELFQTGVYLGC